LLRVEQGTSLCIMTPRRGHFCLWMFHGDVVDHALLNLGVIMGHHAGVEEAAGGSDVARRLVKAIWQPMPPPHLWKYTAQTGSWVRHQSDVLQGGGQDAVDL
jgi:hypothetical protein